MTLKSNQIKVKKKNNFSHFFSLQNEIIWFGKLINSIQFNPTLFIYCQITTTHVIRSRPYNNTKKTSADWQSLIRNGLSWRGAVKSYSYCRETGREGWGIPNYRGTGMKIGGKRSYGVMKTNLKYLIWIIVSMCGKGSQHIEKDMKAQQLMSTATFTTWWRILGHISTSAGQSLSKLMKLWIQQI